MKKFLIKLKNIFYNLLSIFVRENKNFYNMIENNYFSDINHNRIINKIYNYKYKKVFKSLDHVQQYDLEKDLWKSEKRLSFFNKLSFNQILDNDQKTIMEITIRNYQKLGAKNLHDIGCGTGIFCNFLKKNFKSVKIFGYDVNTSQIIKNKKKFNNITFLNSDLIECEKNLQNFDIIFFNSILMFIPDLIIIQFLESIKNKEIYIAINEPEIEANEGFNGVFSRNYEKMLSKFSYLKVDGLDNKIDSGIIRKIALFKKFTKHK